MDYDRVDESGGERLRGLRYLVLDRGMILSGGGGILKGLKERLIEGTSLPTYVDTEDPLSAVVRGNALILEEFDRYKKVLY